MVFIVYNDIKMKKRITQKKLKNIDPKYIGVPNINFTLTTKKDNREKLFQKQRIQRGFDDSETWSLRDTIANFIIPRLDVHEELCNKHIIRDQSLIDNIAKFRRAMELTRRDHGMFDLTEEELKEHEEGLTSFPKIFMTLGW